MANMERMTTRNKQQLFYRCLFSTVIYEEEEYSKRKCGAVLWFRFVNTVDCTEAKRAVRGSGAWTHDWKQARTHDWGAFKTNNQLLICPNIERTP